MNWKRPRLLEILLGLAGLLGLARVVYPQTVVPQSLSVQTGPPPAVTTLSGRPVNLNPVTPATLYYWAIARYPSGSVSNPTATIVTGTVGAANLSGTFYVSLSWSPMPGATGYDILRSESPTYPAPLGTCTCAVVVNTSATTVNDQSPSLSAYTQPAVDLIQLAGKYMFGGGSASAPADANSATSPSPTETTP